jgi:hypothetical protein
MSGSRWLFDDSGEVVASGSNTIAERLGVALRDGLEDYAVENVGWIALSLRRDVFHVRCRPSVVSERAMIGLLYWLLDGPNRPVAISWFDRVWNIERAATTRAAVSCLSYILELKGRPPQSSGPRIRMQPSAQARQRWRKVEELVMGTVRAERLSPALYAVLDSCFTGRWFINDYDYALRRVTVYERGAGYPPLDPVFTRKERGYSLDDLTDPNYRIMVGDSLRDAAENDRPRFDDIDAIVDWSRFGDIRTRYWRIIVPLINTPVSCRLLSASGNDSGIDLRPQVIEEAGEFDGGVVGGHPKQSGIG